MEEEGLIVASILQATIGLGRNVHIGAWATKDQKNEGKARSPLLLIDSHFEGSIIVLLYRGSC